MTCYFITGTGTDIGKTVITAAIAHMRVKAGMPVRVLKPVLTGWQPDNPQMDARVLARASGLEDREKNWFEISPWRFAAPLAPSMAAEKEGKIFTLSEVATHCQTWLSQSTSPQDFSLIEGIGGLMTPLEEHNSVLDLIRALELPVLLVAGSYLGSLSHTLTALRVLEYERIKVGMIIINDSEASIGLTATQKALSAHTSTPIIVIPRLSGADPWSQLLEKMQDTLRRNIAGL